VGEGRPQDLLIAEAISNSPLAAGKSVLGVRQKDDRISIAHEHIQM
jgi:hypothetical protein